MFSKQEKQIKVLEQHEKSLLILLETLKASCFDDEDRNFVRDDLTKIHELKTDFETKLAQKKEIYKTQVQGVERNLKQREVCLQQANKVFEEHPDLLVYFVNKQKQLQDSLKSVVDYLQNS